MIAFPETLTKSDGDNWKALWKNNAINISAAGLQTDADRNYFKSGIQDLWDS